MLAELTSAIDGLAETDPHALTDTELHDTVAQLHRLQSQLAAVAAELTAVWDGRMVWASDGSKSPAARLERDCQISERTARASLTRARRLRTMPATRQAFKEGRLSVDHVDTLCSANQPEYASLFARDETLLVDQALTMDFRKFQRCVTYWKHCADDTRSEEQADKEHAARYLQLSRTFQGSVDVRGLLDPVNGAIVTNEIDRIERALFEQDWADTRAQHGDSARPEQLFRTAGQRRADALVEMARRSAAMTSDHHPARPLVSVLVGLETFTGRVCELADGTPITPGQLVPLLSEADIERVVFDTPARVIEVGARVRFFTGGLRRAIEVRDRHCTHPGCHVPADQCQVDHIVEYVRGGETTHDNGRLLCPVHNRRRTPPTPPIPVGPVPGGPSP